MTFDEFWMRQQYTESKDDKWFAEKVWQAATLAEREECAKVCEREYTGKKHDFAVGYDLDVIRQAIEERDEALQACDDLANEMIYRGNSVAWWHSKATAYREAVDECWKALGEAGIKTDGNTHVADAIRQLAARSNAALTGAEKAA